MMDQNAEHIWILMARKLSGEATAEELAELELLLIQNPGENYSLEVMQDIWNNKSGTDFQHSENKYKELLVRMQRLGIDAGKFSGGSDFIEHDKDIQRPKRKPALYIGGVILICGIMFLLILFINRGTNNSKPQEVLANKEISTKYGTKTSILLPDGTEVQLNSGSKLTYDKNYGNGTREVNLTGEAYFDVIKNPQKPFIIHTGHLNIRVLGTAFNVRCYPDEKSTETSLIRGSLEVTLKNGNEKIILKPNEKLRVINTGIKEPKENSDPGKKAVTPKNIVELGHVSLLPQDNTIAETSWINNRLVFRSESFEDVVLKMEKWYGAEIVFKTEKLKSKKLTGIFENENIYQALDALQLTTKFSYKNVNGQIILSN